MISPYIGQKTHSKDDLETWIFQCEDYGGRLTSIEARSEGTLGLYDNTQTKHGIKPKILMGHLPTPSAGSLRGRAYIYGQAIDVTIYWPAG